MPNAKKITCDFNETGKTVYSIVRREADGYLLNGADGIFSSAPLGPFIALVEDLTMKGRYEAGESRAVWSDGRYTAAVYRQSGGSPSPVNDTVIGSGEILIKDDREVYLDSPPSFVHKWITNRLAENPEGTWKLYDDDGVTVLKTWAWDSGTRTRGMAL